MLKARLVLRKRPEIPIAAEVKKLVAALGERLSLEGVVNIVITSAEEVRTLNLRFRGKDAPTDVLSFSWGDSDPLGEVVIALEVARMQAEKEGHGLLREIQELVLHGILHIAGYDHESDDGTMNRLELELREELLG